MRFWLVLGVALSLAGSLWAAGPGDLDFESAASRYHSVEQAAEKSYSDLTARQDALAKAKGTLLNATQQEKNASVKLKSDQSEVDVIKGKLVDLDLQISQDDAQKKQFESQLSDSKDLFQKDSENKENARDKEASIRQKLDGIQNDIDQAKRDGDDKKVKSLERQRDDVGKEANEAHARYLDYQRLMESAAQDSVTFQNYLDSTDKDLNDAEDQKRTLNQRLQETLNAISADQDQIVEAQSSENLAQSGITLEQAAVTEAKQKYNSDFAAAQSANEYYQTVKASYDTERAKMLATAAQAGTGDGKREADARAASPAETDADRDGAAQGQVAGTTDAKARDMAQGYADGRKNASLDPGLSTVYQAGQRAGDTIAIVKAKATGLADGYNQALKDRLGSVPPTEVNLDLTQATSQTGSTARFSTDPIATGNQFPDPELPPPPTWANHVPKAQEPKFDVPTKDDRYSQPPCTNLVLESFVPLCQSAYEAAYDKSFRAEYARAYQQFYRQAFEKSTQVAYDQAFAPHSVVDYNAGRAEGAVDQGTLDGFQTSLKKEVATQHELGKKRFEAVASTGALARLVSVELVPTSGALYVPGQKVQLRVTVDNYGGQPSAQGEFRITLTKLDGIKLTGANTHDLPPVPPDTRAKMEGAFDLTIQRNWSTRKVHIEASAQQKSATGDYVDAGHFEASAELHYPLELQKVTLAKTPAFKEAVDATFLFKNQTDGDLPASQIAIQTTPVTWEPEARLKDLSVPAVPKGATVEVTGKLTPNVWAGENVPVGFMIAPKQPNADTQYFYQQMSVDREAGIELYDENKKPTYGHLAVNGGSYVTFYVRFVYHRQQAGSSTFTVSPGTASDGGIVINTLSSNAVAYSGATLTSSPDYIRFSYNVAQTLQGKVDQYIPIYLYQDSQVIQAIAVYLDVK